MPSEEDHESPPLEEPEKKEPESFFSFAEEGHLTWWSAAILAVIAAAAVASLIYIAVVSGRRRPSEASRLLAETQCPSGGAPYTSWLAGCRPAAAGSVFHCHGSYDCAALGPSCAPAERLRGMECARVAGEGSVCAVPQEWPPVQGFCTGPGSVCSDTGVFGVQCARPDLTSSL